MGLVAGDNKPVTADGDRCRPTIALPPANTSRWSCRRKAAVILGIRAGILGRQHACAQYEISPEELAAWETAFDRYGIPGLRATRQQIYRNTALEKRPGR